MTNCKKKCLYRLMSVCAVLYLLVLLVPPFIIDSDKSFMNWVVSLHIALLTVAVFVVLVNGFIKTYIAYTECDKQTEEK